jgi:hypothetical protein
MTHKYFIDPRSNAIAHLLAIALLCITSTAGAWSIATVPLFVSTQVVPNVFFELDDSGSMDWSILAKKHWESCAYDPDSGDSNNSSTDSTTCGNLYNTGDIYAYGLTP